MKNKTSKNEQPCTIHSVSGSTSDDDYYNDLVENSPHESCPKCGRAYDDIDFDFQSCSKCGWDAESENYECGLITEPTEQDYLNGDADIMTGEWF